MDVLGCWVLLRLHMHDDVGFSAVVFLEQFLHFRSFVVSLAQGDVAVHEDVQLDGVVIADATGAQIVRQGDTIDRASETQHLRFHLVG